MKGEIQTDRNKKKAKIEHRENKESFEIMDKRDGVKNKKLKKKMKPTSEECDPDEPKAKVTKSTDSSQQQKGVAKQNRHIRQRKDKFKDKVPEFLKLVQSKTAVVKEVVPPVAKTPEELEQESMKEEKRDRMRKKRRDKKLKKGKKIESTVAKDAALQYLSMWAHHRNAWKFQKVRQVWLLSHMYNTDVVEDGRFQSLLEYLEDLKGESKNKTRQEAEKILAEAEREEEGEDDNDGSGNEIEDAIDDNEEDNKDEEEGEQKKKRKQSKSSKDKEDVTSTVRYQRARHVLQILA